MSQIPILRSTMKSVLISMLLLAPSAMGMVDQIALEKEPIIKELLLKGCKPLHIAAYFDDVETIEHLLTAGAQIEAVGTDGQTALHMAAGRGNRAAVLTLLRRGADINARDAKGFSPLYEATARGHVAIIQELLARGALVIAEGQFDEVASSPLHRAILNGDLDAINCFISMRGVKGNIYSVVTKINPLYSSNLLHCAAQNGTRAVIELCIQGGGKVSGRDDDGMTPLLVAARHGQLDGMNCLLDNGAKLEEEHFPTKDRAVHYAAQVGHTELLVSLISRGAKINYSSDFGGKTPPLGYAIENGHLEAAQLLVSSEAQVRQEFLNSAAKTGNVGILELLLDNGLLIDEPDSSGNTALQVAAESGHEDATRFLIKKGAQLELGDFFHRNALHKAAQRGHVGVIKILLAARADINARLGRTSTPLMYAAEESQVKAVECLIEHGASLMSKNAIILNRVLLLIAEKETCMLSTLQCIKALIAARSPISQDSIACAANHLEIMRMLVNAYPSCMADVLLDKHKDVFLKIPDVVRNGIKEYLSKREFYLQHGRFQEGDNLDQMFAVAAYFFDWKVLQALKKQCRRQMRLWRGAQGENLLMVALRTLNVQARRWLLEEELCFIHHRDSNEQNALSIAITLGDLLLINELLDAGAKIRAEHLALASSCGNREIVTKLTLIYYYNLCENKRVGLNLWR